MLQRHPSSVVLRASRQVQLLRHVDRRQPTGRLRMPMSQLGRRAVAELVGTAFLVAAVVGSGIAAQRLSPDQTGLQLLENSLATGAALAVLIIVLQPISAAFNPVVTLAERLQRQLSTRDTVVLIAAQLVGGTVGAVLANLMFGLPPVNVSDQARGGPGPWLGEVVATLGLIMVIFGATRAGRVRQLGWLVGGYITAAYWFTSSTSFANPAVTLARTLSGTFAGIAPSSVPMFILMQLVGAAAGLALITILHPRPAANAAADPALEGTP
jgi:arsenate reductase